MTETASHCPKCQGRMVQGFIADHTDGGYLVGYWVEGAPRKSFWTGAKIEKGTMIPLGVFRCESCGYLESYARDDFAPR